MHESIILQRRASSIDVGARQKAQPVAGSYAKLANLVISALANISASDAALQPGIICSWDYMTLNSCASMNKCDFALTRHEIIIFQVVSLRCPQSSVNDNNASTRQVCLKLTAVRRSSAHPICLRSA
jgi:hypothetical protein